jgi:hypothetical protein
MAVTAGVKSPLDYSVFSASAGALLLAVLEERRYPVEKRGWFRVHVGGS